MKDWFHKAIGKKTIRENKQQPNKQTKKFLKPKDNSEQLTENADSKVKTLYTGLKA